MANQPPLARMNTLACGLSLIGVMFFCLALGACSSEGKAEKLHKQGVLLYKNRKYFNAIKKFEQSLKLNPENANSLALAADAYLQTGKPERAIEYGELAIQINQERYDVYLTIGQAHLDMAVSDMSTTTTVGPGRPAYNQADMDEAARIAQMLRDKQPDSIEGMLLQAKIDAMNRKYDAAQRLYTKAAEIAPDNIIAQLGLSDTLIKQGKFTEAEKALRPQVEGQDNPHPYAISQFALALASQDHYIEAFEVLRPYVSESNSAPVLKQYMLAGNILIEHIQSLKDLDKKQSTESIASDGGLDLLQQAELTAAVDSLARLGGSMKGIYPTRPESFYFRALSYELQGNRQEAIHHFREAINRAPNSKRFRLALALSLLSGKQYEEARQQLRLILRNQPGDQDARLRMAQCYAGEGSYEEALSLLRDLNREKPAQRPIMELMAKVLVLTQETENVDEGLRLLGEMAGAEGMKAGAKEIILAQASVKEGKALSRQGKHKEAGEHFFKAERLFEETSLLQPENAAIELKRAELANLRRDLISALIHTRRAADLDEQYRPLTARMFAQLGQLDAAREIYTRLLEKNPDAVAYQMALVELLVLQGRSEEALGAYDTLIERKPDTPQLYLRKANLLAKTGRRPEAIDLLSAQAETFTDDVPLRLALARMLLQERRTPEAVKHLDYMASNVEKRLIALKAAGPGVESLNQVRQYLGAVHLTLIMAETLNGNYAKVTEHAALSRQFDESLETQASIFEAIALLHQDKAEQAVTVLSGIKGGDHTPPAFPYLYSLALLATGDKAGALAEVQGQANLSSNTVDHYRQLIENNPIDKLKTVAPGLILQIFLAERKTYAQVVLDLADQALEVLPDAPMLLSRKAETLQLLGRADDALAVYKRMDQLQPDFPPVLMAQAQIHKAQHELAVGKQNQAEATQHRQAAQALLEKVLALDPKSQPALHSLADLAQKQNDLETANRYYRKTIEIDPTSWAAYNNLAWNLSESGQLDEAAEVGHKALELVPGVGVVQDTVGWIEYQRRNLDEAERLLKEASLRIPNNPEVRFHLASVLAAREEKEAAVTQLEMLMLATPDFPQIGSVRELLESLAPDSAMLN